MVDLDGDTIRYSIDKAAFEGATFAIDEFSGRITVGAGKQPIYKHILNDLLNTGAGMALDYEAKALLANNLLTPIKRRIKHLGRDGAQLRGEAVLSDNGRHRRYERQRAKRRQSVPHLHRHRPRYVLLHISVYIQSIFQSIFSVQVLLH